MVSLILQVVPPSSYNYSVIGFGLKKKKIKSFPHTAGREFYNRYASDRNVDQKHERLTRDIFSYFLYWLPFSIQT